MDTKYKVIIGICILLVICICLSTFGGLIYYFNKDDSESTPVTTTPVAPTVPTAPIIPVDDTYSDSKLPYMYTLGTKLSTIMGRTSDETIINELNVLFNANNLTNLLMKKDTVTINATFKYKIIYPDSKTIYLTSNSNGILNFIMAVAPEGSNIIETNAANESVSIVTSAAVKRYANEDIKLLN